MRHLLVAALPLLAACDRTAKPLNDSPSTSTSIAAPSPPSSKSGPTPDDPMLSNVAPQPIPPEATTLASGNNTFAFDLWSRVAKTPGNTALSPLSISIALAMTGLGAKAETSAQIKKTLHFEGAPEATAAAWGKVSRALTTPPHHLKLRIANRLFGEQTYKFEQPFLDQTKTHFAAPLEPTDFKTAFEPARKHINDWVEAQTEKRIADLLPANALDPLTRLVLVNAVYFLADWETPFEKTSTSDAPFEVSASVKKNVPTMHEAGYFEHTQAPGLQLLELPYKGGEASMLLVLPDAKEGLSAVEKTLDAKRLDALRKTLTGKRVAVALPRFEISPPTIPLATDLAALGMPLAFDKDKADFTGIGKPTDPRERLYIAKVFHKAFVKVDEKGTEAAAATAVAMAAAGGAPAKPIEFKADHPFLFFIIEKTSGIVLFMGRVSDPSVK